MSRSDYSYNSSSRNISFLNVSLEEQPNEIDIPALTYNTLLISVVLVTTGTPLLAFYREPTLRAPFTIYVRLLLVLNLVTVVFDTSPIGIYQAVHPAWRLTRVACLVERYSTWTLPGVSSFTHVLIAGNRIWALFFPISYRQKHSQKTAAMSALSAVTLVHLISLPLIIVDEVERKQECRYNNSTEIRTLMQINMVVLYDIPILFLFIAFLGICYKTTTIGLLYKKLVSTASHQSGQLVSEISRTSRKAATPGSHESHKLLFLALMTSSILVTWGPLHVIWTIKAFTGLDSDTWIDDLANYLYFLQPVTDSVIFVVSLDELRKACIRIFKKDL